MSGKLLFYWKRGRNQKIHSFIVVTLNRVYIKYDWGNKSGWNKVKNEMVQLPTKNNQIDFGFMETFISAIQKLVIEDVVLHTDKEIKLTEKVIKK